MRNEDCSRPENSRSRRRRYWKLLRVREGRIRMRSGRAHRTVAEEVLGSGFQVCVRAALLGLKGKLGTQTAQSWRGPLWSGTGAVSRFAWQQLLGPQLASLQLLCPGSCILQLTNCLRFFSMWLVLHEKNQTTARLPVANAAIEKLLKATLQIPRHRRCLKPETAQVAT